MKDVRGAGELSEALGAVLNQVVVYPRRLSLETPGVRATAPMLRGVWGAALHGLDGDAYRLVFDGEGPAHARIPLFALRPAAADPADAPAVEWILFGRAVGYDEALLRAWDVASGMGLGPRRVRFRIRSVRPIGPGNEVLAPSRAACGWMLGEARWPAARDIATAPCRLRFPAPLRLMRGGRFIDKPTLPDLVVAAVRRCSSLLSGCGREELEAMKGDLIVSARRTRAEAWHGRRLDLVRYSGRQKAEVELRGVAGYLDLPEGPGELWPLLAAAQWLHIGKGTVVGMGQVVAERLPG